MAYRNSYIVRLVALIDMTFATLLVCIYLHKLLTPSHASSGSEGQRMPSLKLVLLGPIIFNAFQIVMAYNLFTAAGRGCDPLIAYAKSNTWFQFSCLMLMLLFIKLFLILWFPAQGSLGRRDIFGSTLIVLEAVFKIFGLFIVREFVDDLKETLHALPAPQYYCIYTSTPPTNLLITPPPIPETTTMNSIYSAPNNTFMTSTSSYPFNTSLVSSIPNTSSNAPLTSNNTNQKGNSAIIKIV